MEKTELEFESILHPLILKHAYPQFLNGHLRNAVLDAFIAVFDLIRDRTALALDGADLVGRAFSLSEPRLILSELETESGKSDQKGFIQIIQGAYLGIRNPKAHSLQSDLDMNSAAQYLAFASLLARRVELARLGHFIRFDGLYISYTNDGMSCLRFYEDGAVLSVSIGAGQITQIPPAEVAKIMGWLTKENASARDYPRGTYTQDKNLVPDHYEVD
jgi:uncharacterized protein (TIGR02391 family)